MSLKESYPLFIAKPAVAVCEIQNLIFSYWQTSEGKKQPRVFNKRIKSSRFDVVASDRHQIAPFD